ncbi:MAG: electron transport complex subunit RsxD [Halothiobacillus sp. 24-54-40]|jgi:electron transport complex protein RnfD|nr:MAG: electron transport complex subunit RsxD [Halothiobacillus sp. 35-54-62]OYZ85475.1 MAG: electron transport complex subunit RsxD [Halothiobacillus sp. 24-54-40]OZA79156.1 MAG: electron transport complex subunit RsxD [Halothiobacillus sp. 39-53-45]HQS03517.1 RnfABCDGE type electron transport complex subunit D [Halothiobacillus sp.]HQS29915.1 RnfABCDGE type electron transport complex subunit D [Halothiobacillus sp.]
MKFPTQTAPLPEAQNSVQRVMLIVLAALVPGTMVAIALLGWGVLINVVLAITAGLLAEALMLKIRARPVRPAIFDGSVVVLAWIFALCLPNLGPWWLPVFGAIFAVVVAKQLYGGLGFNLFNPAMVGYVVLLISFPEPMTRWGPAIDVGGGALSFAQSLAWSFHGVLPSGVGYDGLSVATPLDHAREQITAGATIHNVTASLFNTSHLLQSWTVWLGLAFLAGGLFMLWRGVIRWHIPVAVITGVLVMSGFLWLIDPARHASPLFHLLTGATIFGAFFVATDPVTASTTPRGRLIFGFGIGVLTVLIRSFGSYPDGVAFAVLLMNLCVPLIDYYTQPKVFGHKRGNAKPGGSN